MDWIETAIYTTTQGIEPVTGRLLGLGIDGFVVKDAQDFESFLNDKDANWDYIDDDLMELRDCETTVTVYIPDDANAPELVAAVRSELAALRQTDESLDLGRLECELKNVREQDWANNWKQYFKPLCVGEKLLIKPSWESVSADDNRKILEIDPAASFGTGQHNTTQLCLELLEQNVQQGDRLLDLGCGSGILSIAAILLGAKSAVAVDIDENSVRIAAENAAKNHISPNDYLALAGNVITDEALVQQIGEGFDVVCANIVADVLVAMSAIFARFIKPGGRLVVSGIIEQRLDEVLESIKDNGFELTRVRQKDDWSAASFVYKN